MSLTRKQIAVAAAGLDPKTGTVRAALQVGNGFMALFYLENVVRVADMLANYRARVEWMRAQALAAWGQQ